MSDSHLQCRAHAVPDHAILLKATAQHGRRERTCGLTARVRLLPVITRSSTKDVIRIPISDAGGQCETKHRLSWTRKRVVGAHYQKDDLLSSSDISGYHADFHGGHGTIGAGQGHGMCELTHGMAEERHAMCESALTASLSASGPNRADREGDHSHHSTEAANACRFSSTAPMPSWYVT